MTGFNCEWAVKGLDSLIQQTVMRNAIGDGYSTTSDRATRVNAGTQDKVGRRDVSETDLVGQSFSLDEAKCGKAQLRRVTPSDQVTLEHLAALSVLARWVDELTVERAGEPS